MNIKVDKNNPIPIGSQIKEQIKILINSGTIKKNEKLPSISQLAKTLGVNKNTIVTVFKELEQEDYIKSFQGKGVFIDKEKSAKHYDASFVDRIDTLVREGKKRKLVASELINLVSARFYQAQEVKNSRVLFACGISQELVDLNLQKLKQSNLGIEVDGLYLGKETKIQHLEERIQWADIMVIPSVFYSKLKLRIPSGKVIIKAEPNFKLLSSLRKGIEKKSKIAVVGSNQNNADLLANMLIAARIFRPKFVIALNDLEKYKKDLKEIDAFVVCISAREAIEKLKLKDREVYFFSDYLDSDTMEDIQIELKKL